jgi:predicted RND superfamily exporter protein
MDTWVRRYAALAMRRPWHLLAAWGLLTLLAVWRGMAIEVDAGLEALLPEDAPSVVALDEARERRGSQDLFVIAVQSPEPLATLEFVDALAEALGDWEEVEHLDYIRDQSFFREHALLYLPTEDLERIEQNLRRIIRQRLGQEHPLFEDLETPTDAEEDEWDWRDWTLWIDPDTLIELNLEEDAVGSLFPFLGDTESDDDTNSDDASSDSDSIDDEEARLRQALRDLPPEYEDYRIASHGGVAVFAAKLRGRSTNIEYARQVYEHAERTIEELDPASFHPELKAQVAGAYQSFLEVRSIVSDATRATQIAVVLILGLLIAFFRNARSIYMVLTPLLVGIAWTLGLIEVLYGHLNTLTVFVFSMLIGMGIDFSIHIYRRILEEWRSGSEWEHAIATSISRTGRALVTATVTTVASLLMLLFASFDGFREFGVACGIGVAICLASAVLVIPPLVGASEKLWPLARPGGAASGTASPERPWILTTTRVVGAAVVLFAIAGIVGADKVQFEYDFGNLSAPRDPDKIRYGAALGQARSSAPAVMLGRDEAQMREVHAELSRRLRSGDPLLRGFTTIVTAVPSEQEQEQRLEAIDDIYSVLDRRAVQRIDGDEGEVIAELTRLTDVEPFGPEELPEWALQQIVERDGSYGSLGLLYGEYDSDDARDVQRFQESYAHIDVPSGRVPISSSGFIIADVVRYVQADARHLALWVTLAIIFILAVDLRRAQAVAVCLATLGAAAGLTMLGMRVFDIKLGLYNVVVLPTVLGVGIDGAVHLYHRFLEDGPESTSDVMRSTGTAVIASSLTTAAGFVGLLLVSHNGIRTLGALAVLGIVASLLSALVLVPALVGRRATGGREPAQM